MSSLPIVLAGPILKAATQHELNIWICTSEKITSGFSASLYQKNAQDHFEDIQTITTSNELHIAPAVFVYLVHIATASDNTFLPRGVFIYYDLYPTAASKKEKGSWFEESRILDQILIEKSDSLPRYILQKKDERLRIIMGSCRKAHGESYKPKDAILNIYKELVDKGKSSAQWPHTLLLAGDQIYADDVAILVSLFLSEKLIPLLLQNNSWLDSALPEGITTGEFLKYRYWRKELFKNKGNGKSKPSKKYGISSDEAHNHLIMWCEFIAIYLIHWNGDFIKDLGGLISTKEAMSIIENYPEPVSLFGTLSREESSLKEVAKEKERPAKLGFADESNVYRKVMANIPTYMLGDDHEVTDDWNFDSNWMENAEGNERATEVIVNGQLAYTVFQILGNSYENSKKIIQNIGSIFNNDRENKKKIEPKLAKAAMSKMSFRPLYHSIIETEPPILLIDTRVNRSPISEKNYTLLSYAQYSYVRDLEESYKFNRRYRDVSYCGASWETVSNILDNRKSNNRNSIILVMAAPVFVPPFIEKLQAKSDTLFGEEFADSEGWKTYPNDMRMLFSMVSQSGIKNVTILAGDIHCAYWSNSLVETDSGELKVVQVVSSGLKNSNSDNLAGFEHRFGTRYNYVSYFESNNSGFICDFTEHYRPTATHLEELKLAAGIFKDDLVCQTTFEEMQSGGRRMIVEYNGLNIKMDPSGDGLEFELIVNDGSSFRRRCEHSNVKKWW